MTRFRCRQRGIAGEQLAVGTQQLLSDLLETLVEFAPENFLNGSLWTRHTRGSDAAECAHLVEAHDFDFRAALRDFWRMRGSSRRPPVTLDSAREFDKTGDETLEDKCRRAPYEPRSYISVLIATLHPSFTLPRIFSTGMCTSRKNNSLNSDSLVI